ncbi:MAG: hypothetical protein ACREFE_11485, partial [Limisphaerales bacterium]
NPRMTRIFADKNKKSARIGEICGKIMRLFANWIIPKILVYRFWTIHYIGNDMNSCFAESDLQNLGNEMLESFVRRVAAIPGNLCAPFHSEARQLETELLTIYKFVALSARRTEDLAQIAKSWGMMVKVCDESAQKLNALVQQHPYCGANSYYDRVLDLRNKCLRLQQMHS